MTEKLSKRPWLLRLDAGSSVSATAATVFGFHFAGGSVNSLRPLRKALDPAISLQLASLPGRASRLAEPPCTDLATVVNALTDSIADTLTRQYTPPAPYLLYGHSMGALLAFEVARALRRRAAPAPQALVVSGARSPQHYERKPQDYSFNLPREDFLNYLRGLEGTPPEFFEHPELIDMSLPVLRADFQICETYRHQEEAPFDFPITAIHGTEDTLVGPDAMHPWGIHTRGPFRHIELRGGHFFIDRHWARIGEEMQAKLRSCSA